MRVGRRTVRGIGEVLITFGLILLLFAIYEVYGRTPAVDAHQASLDGQLNRQWSALRTSLDTQPRSPGTAILVRSTPPTAGQPIARLYIPALRLHWVVVEGVSLRDIQYAPGHYPGTAMPGEVGNFAVAGHRIPPLFWNLQEVTPTDKIVVETAMNWYVYRVTKNEIVSPHAIEVLAPTPDRPGVSASQAWLTLTTCNPKWADYQRMVVHAVLIATAPHSAGSPVPLGSR